MLSYYELSVPVLSENPDFIFSRVYLFRIS